MTLVYINLRLALTLSIKVYGDYIASDIWPKLLARTTESLFSLCPSFRASASCFF